MNTVSDVAHRGNSEQKMIAAELKSLGDLVTLRLVGRHNKGDRRGYRYRAEFGRVRVLQHIVFNAQNLVDSVRSEASEFKPGVHPGARRPCPGARQP